MARNGGVAMGMAPAPPVAQARCEGTTRGDAPPPNSTPATNPFQFRGRARRRAGSRSRRTLSAKDAGRTGPVASRTCFTEIPKGSLVLPVVARPPRAAWGGGGLRTSPVSRCGCSAEQAEPQRIRATNGKSRALDRSARTVGLSKAALATHQRARQRATRAQHDNPI